MYDKGRDLYLCPMSERLKPTRILAEVMNVML